jgi:hypothetical protein
MSQHVYARRIHPDEEWFASSGARLGELRGFVDAPIQGEPDALKERITDIRIELRTALVIRTKLA